MSDDSITERRDTWTLLGVVAFALFLDYFLYGTVIPLTPVSPAGVKSEAEIGLLYGVYALSVLLLAPLFGYVGGRAGSRMVLLYGAGFAVCAAVLFGLGSNFFVLLLARLCQGAASGATWTAGLALVAEHYADRRVEMMGYAFTGSTAGSVLGPVIGGWIYHFGGYRFPFAINAVLFAVEACLVIWLLPSGGRRQQDRASIWTLARNKQMRMAAIAILLAAFGWGIMEPLMPAHLIRYGASVQIIGVIFTISAVVYGIFAPVVGRASERFPAGKVMAAGAIAMAITLPSVSAFKRAGFVAVALCVVNVSYAFVLNPASAELANAADRAGMTCYSSAYAIYNIVYSIGMIAASGFASIAGKPLGFRGTLLIVSGVLLLSTLWMVLSGSWMPGESAASLEGEP